MKRLADWIAGAAVTLMIKYRQPWLYETLVKWTDDDPIGD